MSRAASNGYREAPWLMAATVAVLAVTAGYGLVSFHPVIRWEVDPRAERADVAVTALGPAGSLWMAAVALAVAAFALWAHRRAGGGLDPVAGGLALLGGLACAAHMPSHVTAAFRGAHWLAGAGLGVAALHLARHEQPRRWLAGGVVGLAVPFFLESGWYLLVEHERTVAAFLEREAEFLRARGWERGSPQHELFKRRLMTPTATGAFGLANVYGSIAAAIGTIAAALAAAHGVTRAWGRAGAPAVLFALAAAVVAMTGSRGAGGALAVGAACAVVAAVSVRGRRIAPFVALILVAAPIAVVVARGVIGPPDTPEGERSLLFRAQYWQGAWRLLVDRPSALVGGIGPERFQTAYARYKPPLSPETVQSTHNVFLDYAVMLGAAGLGWVALLGRWVWQAGRSAAHPIERAGEPGELQARALGGAMAVAALAFGLEYALEWPMMLPSTLLLWLVGIGGFVVTLLAVVTPGWQPKGATRLGLGAAGVALLVHGQIEMTFFHQGAAPVAWAVVGAAAGAGVAPSRGARGRWSAGVPAVPVAAALFVAAACAVPATRAAGLKAEAASALRAGRPEAARRDLAAAAEVGLPDPDVVRWRARLHLEAARRAHRRGARQRVAKHCDRAASILERARDRGLEALELLRLRARVAARRARWLDDAGAADRAVRAYRRLVERSPHSLRDRLALADLLWRLGRREPARRAYRACLEIEKRLYLDPARGLSKSDRARVERRLGRKSGDE